MFGFIKDIKNAVAAVEARVKAVEEKIEAYFDKAQAQGPVTNITTTTEASNATQEGR